VSLDGKTFRKNALVAEATGPGNVHQPSIPARTPAHDVVFDRRRSGIVEEGASQTVSRSLATIDHSENARTGTAALKDPEELPPTSARHQDGTYWPLDGEMSPSELLANPDGFDGQAVTLHGTVEKFREGVSPDGAPYYKFRLSDEQTAARVFSFGRSPCRNGMQATVEGIFEKANRLGARTHYNEVTATRVTCR
jgi:hypothetical protein